mmetsp:Transcript_19758/g.61179  ORF Transcript_19758/g.61179 Transcript_19758/m.61179 type:complete len:121 (-) Transcript_19758:199-561(-)
MPLPLVVPAAAPQTSRSRHGGPSSKRCFLTTVLSTRAASVAALFLPRNISPASLLLLYVPAPAAAVRVRRLLLLSSPPHLLFFGESLYSQVRLEPAAAWNTSLLLSGDAPAPDRTPTATH